VQCAGLTNLWHPVKSQRAGFRATRPSEATSPRLNASRSQRRQVRARQTRGLALGNPSIEVVTAAYQRISDGGVGPKFLGHLTEGKDGRVVGFVAEWVEGARAAGPGDIDRCKKASGPVA